MDKEEEDVEEAKGSRACAGVSSLSILEEGVVEEMDDDNDEVLLWVSDIFGVDEC